MPRTILQNQDLTVRKPHRCHGCGRSILRNQKARLVVGVDAGDFDRAYVCRVCDALAERHDLWSDWYYADGFPVGAIYDHDPETWMDIQAELESETPANAKAN